jgi:dipeptidyl aminopeptidase/acylaminoacyl peptidase
MSKVDPNTKITITQTLSGTPRYSSYVVSYPSDSLTLYSLLHIPKGQMPEGGWPVVVVNHGYIPPAQYSTVNSYKNTSAFYANSGFLVFKPDYRGHDNSEGESVRPLSRTQYALDVLNLIAGIDSIPEANPASIFLYGHSMGGEVSLIVSALNPSIKGVSLWAPAVTSYPESINYFSRRQRPTPTSFEDVIAATQKLVSQYGSAAFSSFENLNKLSVPLLVHHGTADESVPYEWGISLVQKLKDSGKTVTFYSYPRANHDISSGWSVALNRDVTFFISLLTKP